MDVAPPRRAQEHPLNAAPEDQLRLLDVQDLDSALDRLAHRERTLPAHARIAEIDTELARLRDYVVAAETETSDVTRQQKKAEDDVAQVRARADRDTERLNSGAGVSPKDLENLQREVESLAKRQNDLEEVELEVMERLEDVQGRLAQLREQVTTNETARAEAVAERDAELAVIAADRTRTQAERSELAGGLPADLSALYEKVRESKSGVGAARLHQRRCEGCRLEINATELVRIRDAEPDELVRCEECRRILVRTPESGL